MSTPTITIIGSLNTDLVTLTPRLPSAGETLISSSFSTGSGGKGANQAVACARLSRPRLQTSSPTSSTSDSDITIHMIGAIGSDPFGASLLHDLQHNNINTTGISTREGQRSGVAVIIVEENTGENRILMSPNANFSLRPSDFMSLPAPLPDMLVLQLEIPLDTTMRILEVAREKGVEVLLNPAPAQVLPREAWEAVGHLIVNESEAGVVAGVKGKVKWWTWGEHVEQIVDLGVRHVTITLGGKGVIYLDGESRVVWPFRAQEVKVVDTTAAGDTFVGAYAVAIMKLKGKGGNVASAVEWANAAAAKTVERRGAQTAIPWSDEVEAFDGEVEVEGITFDMWKKEVVL